MKASSASSAKGPTDIQPRTGRSSAQPTPTRADDFSLGGPSKLPDPAFHAYRRDLADVRLAGVVIASHYAEPLERRLTAAATMKAAPADESAALAELRPGDPFLSLEDSVGWAWGYGGAEQRVGYVRSEALGPC